MLLSPTRVVASVPPNFHPHLEAKANAVILSEERFWSGSESHATLVKLSNGESLTVKQPRQASGFEHYRQASTVLSIIGDSFREVPKVWDFDGMGERYGRPTLVLSSIPGVPASELRFSPQDNLEIGSAIGSFVRRLQRFPVPSEIPAEKLLRHPRDIFASHLKFLSDSIENSGLFPSSFFPVLAQLVEDRFSHAAAIRCCLAHGDLHPGNILVDPRTKRLTGIIDFDQARFDAPEVDYMYMHGSPLWLGFCRGLDRPSELSYQELLRVRMHQLIAALHSVSLLNSVEVSAETLHWRDYSLDLGEKLRALAASDTD